jgi:hypothetical protein
MEAFHGAISDSSNPIDLWYFIYSSVYFSFFINHIVETSIFLYYIYYIGYLPDLNAMDLNYIQEVIFPLPLLPSDIYPYDFDYPPV